MNRPILIANQQEKKLPENPHLYTLEDFPLVVFPENFYFSLTISEMS